MQSAAQVPTVDEQRAPAYETPSEEPLPEPAQAPLGDFSWTKQWYAIAILSDLDPTVPTPTKLLGRDLVMWRDNGGKWRCLEDRCPHRLAALSDGRIEPSDGTLQCSYHGWRFGPDGRAAAIPQAEFDSPKAQSSACASRRSCVAAFPTAEAGGFLFVWGEAGAAAVEESAAKPLPIHPRVAALKPDEIVSFTHYFSRDFPIAHDIILENISDQSHVPWAHHGVASNRKSVYAAHFRLTDVNADLPPGGEGYTYRLEWSPDAKNPPIDQVVTFTAPTRLDYWTEGVDGESGKFSVLSFYVVPLDDNHTRVLLHSVSSRRQKLPVARALLSLFAMRPPWVDHLVLNEVFDGDLPNLLKGAYNIKVGDPLAKNWARSYFLPATADKSVLAMRSWYLNRGKGGFALAAGRSPEPPPKDIHREALLDRFHQHTAKCRSCTKALEQLRTAQTVLKTAAAAAMLLAAVAMGQASAAAAPLNAAAVAAAGAVPVAIAAIAMWLSATARRTEALFLFKNYDHAHA